MIGSIRHLAQSHNPLNGGLEYKVRLFSFVFAKFISFSCFDLYFLFVFFSLLCF